MKRDRSQEDMVVEVVVGGDTTYLWREFFRLCDAIESALQCSPEGKESAKSTRRIRYVN